jgi:hypothetical protein
VLADSQVNLSRNNLYGRLWLIIQTE